MRFVGSIFSALLKPIDRRAFKAIVARHDGDAYDKRFSSWEHLLALIFAQLSGAASLRGLATVWNANAHHHYHLGAGKVARSTLADANARRPACVFAETFQMLVPLAGRALGREGAQMLRLIDSTPIPLPALCAWAKHNGRIRGLKMHVVYDPGADLPRRAEITGATVNDVEIGRLTPLEAGATYVFDKGYCAYEWWAEIHAAQAFFVTRPKTNAGFQAVGERPLEAREATGAASRDDGFTLIDDGEVVLASRRADMLPMILRRVRLMRDNGAVLTLITNDRERAARDIALLYKARWAIELLFRWVKQHLKLRVFLGRSENAVRLQALAAMIAFVLLRIAQRVHGVALAALRFADLARACLFQRKPIARIDRPPDSNAAKPSPKIHPDQIAFRYA